AGADRRAFASTVTCRLAVSNDSAGRRTRARSPRRSITSTCISPSPSPEAGAGTFSWGANREKALPSYSPPDTASTFEDWPRAARARKPLRLHRELLLIRHCPASRVGAAASIWNTTTLYLSAYCPDYKTSPDRRSPVVLETCRHALRGCLRMTALLPS